MDHGHIVEQGTPEELLLANGLYRQLYDIQMARGGERQAQRV